MPAMTVSDPAGRTLDLAALRGTHQSFTRELGAAREEIAATRGALEATAETAAARLRKVKALRGAA